MECPGRGSWWGESKEANKPPTGQKLQKGDENGWFPALFGIKIIENTVIPQKYLKRYTPEMFFEEYIIFKKFKDSGVLCDPSSPD
jgi:hypothetical protein